MSVDTRDRSGRDRAILERLRRPGARLGVGGVVVLVLVALILLSLTRIITGADDISSSGALGATISLAVPLGLAGLGGLWAERAGVVNIGLEGMMIMGTFFGAWFAYEASSAWMMIVGGMVGGIIGGAVHALATVTFGVDHIVSGVAINIAALGSARFLAGVFFKNTPGGGSTQSPRVDTFSAIGWLQSLGDNLFQSLEEKHWFLLSDVAGLLRGVLTSMTWFTLIAILLVPLSWFVLWRTAFGLRLRSCGEKPSAAESLGVNVYRIKWIAVLISGAMAGLAGGFLVQLANIYREGQTGGRGYIGLAALIFGNWRPGGLTGGAALFGYVDALQLRNQPGSVRSLLVLAIFVLVPAAAWVAWRSRSWKRGVALLIVAVVLYVVFALVRNIPQEFTSAAPYVVTLLVLALASQRLRPPKADGLQWRKGQRE